MKRVLVLLLGVILLFFLNGSAEKAEPVFTEFEDFTLQTGAALEYSGEKADGQPLFMYYPSAEGNITMAAVNAVWSQDVRTLTPEEFHTMCRETEDAVRAQYEAGGLQLVRYETGTAVEEELWGLPILRCDTELLIRVNDTETKLSQRVIRVTGTFGTYLFSLSAWSPELLDEATDMLVSELHWK